MATITDKRSINAILTSTTHDVARLTQEWDTITVTNNGEIGEGAGVMPLEFTDDGATTPTSGAEGTILVPAGESKTIKARRLNPAADMSGTVVCHEIRVVGNANWYSVEGNARAV
jgi:hypothetical protein